MIRIIICSLVFFTTTYSYAQKGDTMLTWGQRDLQWTDFRGSPPTEKNNVLAITSSGIGKRYRTKNDTLRFYIYTHFFMHKSWTIIKTDYALNHERRHFDVSEVVARRIRKFFSELNLTTIDELKIDEQLYSFDSERIALQNEYDKGTNFGRDTVKQAIWDAKIRKMLTELEAYKQPYGKVKTTVIYSR